MPQKIALLDTLKREIRRQGYTYADVAKALDLSEATIKRSFSLKSLSLDRLDAICQWLGMEISDLVQRMEGQQTRLNELTEPQERELVSDIKLLLVALALLHRWTFEEILSTYQITEIEGIRLMARLDRMGVIELLPRNQVRLRVSRNFGWLPNGPIQRFFEEHVQNDYFRSRFVGPGEKRVFLSGMLSRRANVEIMRRIEKLAMEFNLLVREDENLALSERFGTSVVLAMRPWEPSVFAVLRREPNLKRF